MILHVKRREISSSVKRTQNFVPASSYIVKYNIIDVILKSSILDNFGWWWINFRDV